MAKKKAMYMGQVITTNVHLKKDQEVHTKRLNKRKPHRKKYIGQGR